MTDPTSQMDQEWAEARDWLEGCRFESLLVVTDLLADESSDPIIALMRRDRVVADCVQRLALLALHELCARKIRDGAE